MSSSRLFRPLSNSELRQGIYLGAIVLGLWNALLLWGTWTFYIEHSLDPAQQFVRGEFQLLLGTMGSTATPSEVVTLLATGVILGWVFLAVAMDRFLLPRAELDVRRESLPLIDQSRISARLPRSLCRVPRVR